MRSPSRRSQRRPPPWVVLSGQLPQPEGPTDAERSCDPPPSVALDCNDPDVASALTLLRSMSLEEKVQQMSGPPYNPNNIFDQEDNTRLGIPGFKYMDGPRGVRWYNSDYGTTVFPVAAARGRTVGPRARAAHRQDAWPRDALPRAATCCWRPPSTR